jgi:hypothetical protein
MLAGTTIRADLAPAVRRHVERCPKDRDLVPYVELYLTIDKLAAEV